MKRAGDIAQWKHLLSVCKALGSVPSKHKKGVNFKISVTMLYSQMNIYRQQYMVSELTHLIQLHRAGISLSRFQRLWAHKVIFIQHLEFYFKTKYDI